MWHLTSRCHFHWLVGVATVFVASTLFDGWTLYAAWAQAASSSRVRPFPVFDATLYRNKPDLSATGMFPIVGAYSGHFGATWHQVPDQLPPKDRVQQVAREAVGKASLAFLDIEHWPQKGNLATVTASVNKYVQVAQWFREAAPGLALGYYGVPPVQDYWRAINSSSSPDYVSWMGDNDRLRPLADIVDIFFPSLYTFYDDREGWRQQAIAQITEARRYGGGKPIYVFLWPQFHDSNPSLGWKYLPTDFWQLELEIARQYADGIVIWGGWGPENQPVDWNERAPWWTTTKAFLAKLKAAGRSQSRLAAPRHLRVQ